MLLRELQVAGADEHVRALGKPRTVTQGARACPQSGWCVGLFVVRRHELTDESWAVIEPLL
ncbi:hypothetical protein, partial [Streptomyces sp. NRRL S-475]|uniref:hypothetical protein n=1 Tax=Streptomyces sp. NRRL S-475 TaxID=1463910 RepID=UPI00131BF5B1